MIDEHHLRELFDATPDAMVAVDESGTIVWANLQCERVFGWDRAELVGQTHDVLVPEPSRALHDALRRRYLEHPVTRSMAQDLPLEGRRHDGSCFPAEISLSASRSDDGVIVLAAVRDVTDRKEAEQQLLAARETAEVANAANRAKDDFLSRMSHELRTPLNAIVGFAQILKRESLTGTQHEDVEHIDRAGHHLLDLIDDVLDISRIETGHLSLSPEPVAVAELVHDATDLVRPLATARDIRITTERCATAYVTADRQRIKQVMLNLLSNAIKYNSAGGSVTIQWRPTAEGIRISVADTGPGIPPALMDRLFSPFDRLGADPSRTDGIGLGLALSNGLVQLMGGSLSATSQVGEGTVFFVDLPIAPAPLELPERAGATATGPAPTVHDFTVLYVEDQLSNIRLMERIMGLRPGIKLVPAVQGALAIELVREQRPDLVLLDVNLPDMEGHDVLAELLALTAPNPVPVVVLSADASPSRIRRLLDRGAEAYVTKPIELAAFLDLLDAHLATRATRD